MVDVENFDNLRKRRNMTALALVRKLFPDVESVVDARNATTIIVKEKDVNAQARKKHSECALALACKREKNLDGAIIQVTFAYLIKGKQATRYRLPESASREIVSFDRHADFSLGEYHMTPPPASSRLGQTRGGHGEHKFKKRAFKIHRTEGVRERLNS